MQAASFYLVSKMELYLKINGPTSKWYLKNGSNTFWKTHLIIEHKRDLLKSFVSINFFFKKTMIKKLFWSKRYYKAWLYFLFFWKINLRKKLLFYKDCIPCFYFSTRKLLKREWNFYSMNEWIFSVDKQK